MTAYLPIIVTLAATALASAAAVFNLARTNRHPAARAA